VLLDGVLVERVAWEEGLAMSVDEAVAPAKGGAGA
jgi:hypothetical protein